MSRRKAQAKPTVNMRGEIAEWFGLTEKSKGNRDLIVRRGELLGILNALERARKKNTAGLRFRRWIAGKALVSLNPVRLLAMKRKEDG